MAGVRFGLAAAVALVAAPALAVTGARVERIDDAQVKISWQGAAPVSVFVATDPAAPLARATPLAAGARGGSATVPSDAATRRYFLLRGADGRVTRVAERVLPLAQGSNFRDLGGYAAAGGKTVRWGRIFRSGATPLLTDADVARIKALGIRDMIDLRSSEERLLAPTRLTGIRYTTIDYSMMSMMQGAGGRPMTNGADLYRNLPAFLAPQIRIVFEDLLAAKGPVLFHCTAGQDRTGFTSALVLSALGVPYATIVEDYHLSTAVRQPKWELDKIDPALAERNAVAKFFAGYQASGAMDKAQPLKSPDGTPFLDGAFAEIKEKWGSVDGYLTREIGLSKADLARLRLLYLE